MYKDNHAWIRNPDWWEVIVTAFGTIFITVLLAIIGYWLNRNAEKRQVISLRVQLEDSDKATYGPAVDALIGIGSRGSSEVMAYIDKNECIPWQKARYLKSRIYSFSDRKEDRAKAIKMLLTSWACVDYRTDIGVALYEALSEEDSATVCPIFMRQIGTTPGKIGAQLELLERATVLVTVRNVCQGQWPQLDVLESSFYKDLKVHAGPLFIQVRTDFFWPISRVHRAKEDVEAKPASWRKIILNVMQFFSKIGPNGTKVLWTEIQHEKLSYRLALGQIIVYFANQEGNYAVDEERAQLVRWVGLGLGSKDSESKRAAITAVGNLGLNQYKQSLQELSSTEDDPTIRDLAGDVVTYLSKE